MTESPCKDKTDSSSKNWQASVGHSGWSDSSPGSRWSGRARRDRGWYPSGHERASAAGIMVQGGTIWFAEMTPNLPNTGHRHVIRLCGEGDKHSNTFHCVRDRLEGGNPLHGRWDNIEECRETLPRDGEVHTMDLGIHAPDTPMRDFQLSTHMEFLAKYLMVDVRHDAPPSSSSATVVVSPPPSSSTDLVVARTCPQGHHYQVQTLLYSGSCNECGRWIPRLAR